MDDMTLNEFINKTDASNFKGEWCIKIPLFDGTKGRIYVKKVKSEFEAKEQAFIYLNNIIKKSK